MIGNMPSNILKARFEPRTTPGTKEHYFHFLHGYLLPCLNLALSRGYQNIQFDDCGPVMEPRLREACNLLSVTYVPPEANVCGDTVVVPRWDRMLLHFEDPPPPERVISAFYESSAPLVNRLIAASKSALDRKGNPFDIRPDEVIVFQRSEEDPFYLSAQMAQFPRYGKGRRNLVNGAEVTSYLSDQGIAARLLDFGILSLAEQIVVCSRAGAILGIRGAEFANVIWMRPESRAILLAPKERENHATRTLARAMRVKFYLFPVESSHVTLRRGQMQAICAHLTD
jgi:hypothetical protein